MSTQNDSQDTIPQYDAHIVPAESVARQHREGEDFGHTSHVEANGELSEVTDGYTVDKEGLLNNYAVEPEMYANVPGDMPDQGSQKVSPSMQELMEDENSKLVEKD